MVIGAVAQPARTVAEAINKIGWKKLVFTVNPLVSALVQCDLAAFPSKILDIKGGESVRARGIQ